MNDGELKREGEAESFLGRKRSLDILQSNYLFRRFLSPAVENDYEKITNLYSLLMSFDWNEDKTPKNSIIQNIRGNSFWFYLSSAYFPFYSNELVDKADALPDALRKFIIDPQAQAKQALKKTSLSSKKEKFMKELLSLTKGGESIANAISSIEKSINIISINNNDRLNSHIKREFILTDKPEVRYYGKPELRQDIEYHSKALKKFVDYIKNKNETNNAIAQQEETDPDDVECVICNDGDYENDNLIVYCSMCHITVHQKCYGIVKVPEDDWVCHLCISYGPNSSQQCILCPVTGGAMKTCSLRKSSNFYNFIMASRLENSINCITSFEEKSDKQKVLFSVSGTVNRTLDETPVQSQSTPKHMKKGDCESVNSLINSVNKYINDKIANEHAWVHMSCALWIPEISINNYEEKEEIKGVESIGKKRYGDSCGICLLKGYGPTAKCERCDLSFHVECARKNHYTLESTDNQMGENKFHIFCLRHAPHKLIKSRELRKQREIDDIIQFSKILNKHIENHNKTHKKSPLSVCIRSKGVKKVETSQKIKLNLIERKRFINAVRQLAIDISSLSVKVIKRASLDSECSSGLYSIKKEEKIRMSYTDLLSPSKMPWYMLKETEPYLKGLLPIDIFKIFKGIVANEYEYARLILRKIIKKDKDKSGAAINQPKKSLMPQPVMTYCYCRKNGDAPFMVGCENGDDCVNNGWYHQECVEELRQLSRVEIQSESFTFTCAECKKKRATNVSNDALMTDNTISSNISNIISNVNL